MSDSLRPHNNHSQAITLTPSTNDPCPGAFSYEEGQEVIPSVPDMGIYMNKMLQHTRSASLRLPGWKNSSLLRVSCVPRTLLSTSED